MESQLNGMELDQLIFFCLGEGMKIGHEPSESESALSVEARSGSNKLVDADMDSPGTEERYPCGTMSNNHEDCSTSGNK